MRRGTVSDLQGYAVYREALLKSPDGPEKQAVAQVAAVFSVSVRKVEQLKEKYMWVDRFAQEKQAEFERLQKETLKVRKHVYSNLVEAAHAVSNSLVLRSLGRCHMCNGQGTRVNMSDQLRKADVRITCVYCKGTGDADNSKINAADLKAMYDLCLALWGSNPNQEGSKTTGVPIEEWRESQNELLRKAGFEEPK